MVYHDYSKKANLFRTQWLCIAVMMAERLQPNGTSSLLSTLSPADIGLQAATANGDDSSDGDEKMTRSKRRKKTRVSR